MTFLTTSDVGEYTTGYVNEAQSTSDKKVGVVALTLFDLRKVGFAAATQMT